MGWKCPEDWKYIPKMEPASDGMLMSILFSDHKRWRTMKSPWFRRCNASGKWIWPLQKCWYGVVAIGHTTDPAYGYGTERAAGSYAIAWLNEDQFIIQKLKGNI